jgi:hypothetical protein
MPEDAYYFLGHEEQIIGIIPSRDLVIVRLGLTETGGDWDHARDLAPIGKAFPPTDRCGLRKSPASLGRRNVMSAPGTRAAKVPSFP